jgi:hypothetical protein
MSGVLSSFVDGLYAEREFCCNALRGLSAYRIATDTTRMLDETMRDHVMGKRFVPEGMAADDRRYAVAARVVEMVIRRFASDFTGENAPYAMLVACARSAVRAFYRREQNESGLIAGQGS